MAGWTGYAFAGCYATGATILVLTAFKGNPLPRFADIYLIGVVLTAFLFYWRPALLLFLYSLAVTIYLLPPAGQMRISRAEDLYRLASYSVCSLFLMALIQRTRFGPAARERQRHMAPE
jgi:hypothetical protein